MVGRAGSHARGPQRIEHSAFLRKLAVIALVDGKHHVNDRTGDKHDHSRKQDGKP